MIRRNEDARKFEDIGEQVTKTKVRNRVNRLEMARSHTTSHEDRHGTEGKKKETN